VEVVCELLDARELSKARSAVVHLSEDDLRYELVACMLGSQVRLESADAAVGRLAERQLLCDARWNQLDKRFESDVLEALSNVERGKRAGPAYRFPNLRARQLAHARQVLVAHPLGKRLLSGGSAKELRAELVRDLPGIGPKQASMFLRNVGLTYDLAILDVHVLHFLRRMRVVRNEVRNLGRLDSYELVENLARKYANGLGRSVGYLDWAVWITMRAAKEVRT
jgi:N-glycosylase/DNA lyase